MWANTLMVLCCAVWAGATDSTAAGEMRIHDRGAHFQLITDDGLRLTLDKATGNARFLAVGTKAHRLDHPVIRFEEVIEDPHAPNLLEQASSEHWGIPASAQEEQANGHPGRWMRVSGTSNMRPHISLHIGQTDAQPLVLSGTCQAQVQGTAFGWWNRHLAMNANVHCVDGTRMPEVSAYFGQYNHGPQTNKRIICPDRPIQSVDIDLSVPAGECTAWYSDVTLRPARYRILSPQSRVQQIDSFLQQEFHIDAADLQGLVMFQPGSEAIEIQCLLQSTQAIDRAISAWVTIPFDAVGGKWHDDVRRSQIIEAGKLYRDARWYGAGRDGYNSRYPFACIETATGEVLAIGTTVDEPRVFQIEYDAERRELRIRFDLGLSPEAGSWANRTSCTAYLFTCTGGYRGAAAKYYRLFDWAFKNRVQRMGIWLPFLSPRAVAGGHDDFQFGFLESVGNMSWDERQGMYSFVYTEPWIHHHELPPHVPAPEVKGEVDPMRSIALAQRIAQWDLFDTLPLDMRRRYPAYPGSYVEDPWGYPQGYFFRGSRNENMMIVNPDERIPPPRGAAYSSGAWDLSIVHDTMHLTHQWYIPGWVPTRVSARQYPEIDETQSAAGRRSLVLRPVEGRSYWEQHLRGLSQTLRGDGSIGPYTFRYTARAEQVPEAGTAFRWHITLWYGDGKHNTTTFPVTDLSTQWRKITHTVPSDKPPIFISVVLDSPTWTPDTTSLWIDEISLTRPDGRELLHNGGFEEAELLPCRLDGVYLDTMECYEANLNYRRAHWAFTDAPLTFDSARRPAMHQIFTHAGFARRISERLHPRDMLVFGNCTPTTPFAAPWLDILGNELNWKHGDRWAPWPDTEFNFARFMSGAKPYCLLQYGNLTVEEQTKYVKRCLFYGVLPSNQAAPSGGWYWADPVIVNTHRPIFAKYVPVIIQLAEAGWQPLTRAGTDDPAVWLERFGDGRTFYLTVFNASDAPQTTRVKLDPDLQVRRITEVLSNKRLPLQQLSLTMQPEDVALLRVECR